MKTPRLLIAIVLFTLFQQSTNTQSKNLNKTKLIGNWAMFSEKHPNGWKTWEKPYEYPTCSSVLA